MAPLSQIIPIHRTNTNSSISNNDYKWFNAFDFSSGQDEQIRWLSRPNQQSVQQKYSHDTEKFRITFDVENFQADQIKIYIQHRKLTISGVYEERSEGHFMQKQFERTLDIPANADVDSMASYITPAHMLVVEIPLNSSTQIDNLNINENLNNKQRRLSFSLNKFNTSDNEGLLSTSNDSSNLSTGGQQVRRTSMSKTTTTTTTSGSSTLPPEAVELLKSADTLTGSSTQTYSTHTSDRHSSNTGNQLLSSQPNTSSSTSSKHTTLTSSDLANLSSEIPSELLASGGTITIQKRRVSVTRGMDGSADQSVPVPLTHSNDTNSTSSTTRSTTHSTNQTGSVPITRSNDTQSPSSTTTTTTHSTNQTGSVPITRSNDTQSSLSSTTTNNTPSNTLNQQQLNTSERRNSKTISSSNQSQMYTLEEFLQNKTWNPSLVDASDGKKILHMRLQMKPGTKSDQMKISLNGHDLRVEVDNNVSTECGRQISGYSYHQVTLFRSCEVDQLKTEFKDDGYLHIQAPINL